MADQQFQTKYLLCYGVWHLAKWDESLQSNQESSLVDAAKQRIQRIQQNSTIQNWDTIRKVGKVFREKVVPNTVNNKIENVVQIIDSVINYDEIPKEALQRAFIDVALETISGGVTRAAIIFTVFAAYAVIRHYLKTYQNQHIFDFIETVGEILYEAFQVCNMIWWLQNYGWDALQGQKRNFKTPIIISAGIIGIAGLLLYTLSKK